MKGMYTMEDKILVMKDGKTISVQYETERFYHCKDMAVRKTNLQIEEVKVKEPKKAEKKKTDVEIVKEEKEVTVDGEI